MEREKDKWDINAGMQLVGHIINANSSLGRRANKATQLILNIGNEHKTTWGLYMCHVKAKILVIGREFSDCNTCIIHGK